MRLWPYLLECKWPNTERYDSRRRKRHHLTERFFKPSLASSWRSWQTWIRNCSVSFSQPRSCFSSTHTSSWMKGKALGRADISIWEHTKCVQFDHYGNYEIRPNHDLVQILSCCGGRTNFHVLVMTETIHRTCSMFTSNGVLFHAVWDVRNTAFAFEQDYENRLEKRAVSRHFLNCTLWQSKEPSQNRMSRPRFGWASLFWEGDTSFLEGKWKSIWC